MSAKSARTILRKIPLEKLVQSSAPPPCQNPCALHAFQEWRDATLTPSFNFELNFDIPKGKRAVIELITAEVAVPVGEFARLRLFTGIGTSAGNFDLILVPQGEVGGKTIYHCTHAIKAYADTLLAVNINRDNATTQGHALVGISGYLIDD
jgi:hypothetical protein